MSAFLRAYAAGDRDALYDICVRTADGGSDARGMYSSDLVVGDIFAVPYATFQPEHTHVLDDGSGQAVGYVLGTTDTAAFVRWYREEWLAQTASRHPSPADAPQDTMLALHHDPERMLVAGLEAYPAHLHIDLLPEWQRAGWGRRLMLRFLAGLHAAGAPAVHLGMLSSNTAARAFYDRLGFVELSVPDSDPVTYLGRSTATEGMPTPE